MLLPPNVQSSCVLAFQIDEETKLATETFESLQLELPISVEEHFTKGGLKASLKKSAKFKHKATTPLKKLTPAIKLARENAHLKLKGSTPSGYYKRPSI